MNQYVSLRSQGAKATLSTTGAEITSWQVDGRDLIWPGDAASWARSAPVLFPVVGWCRDKEIRVNGIRYPMPVHGFAPRMPFTIMAQEGASVTLRLADSDDTRRHYPFAFRLTVTISLNGPELRYDCSVDNDGEAPLPYALGLHPGFSWPLSGAGEHWIETDAIETASVPDIAEGGLFSDQRRAIPLEGHRLTLTPELLAREALCFLDANSRGLRYCAPDGTVLTAQWRNFAHFALWNRNAAPFLCIETWTGHGDPVGFAGDFTEKPGILLLPPHGSARHGAVFSFASR